MTAVLDRFKRFTVPEPRPLIGAETIQIILLREILDYTVLRTEETRELNTATTPRSIAESDHDELRVAFLGSKQKAAESRTLEQMLRTATQDVSIKADECYLKDHLCLECPRCALFGATKTDKSGEKPANIKHRIEYSTAFSLMPFRHIGDSMTFNAIDDLTLKTGQALGTRYVVKPASLFPSIVTLRSVTLRELVLALKTLLACKSYGAEARTGGDVRNTIYGVVCGWEEIITPLELTLELYDLREELNKPESLKMILDKYKVLAGNQVKVEILDAASIDDLVKEVSETPLDKTFLDAAYNDVRTFRAAQG